MFYAYPKKLDIEGHALDINIYLNPDFAAQAGVNNGDVVVIHTKDGEIAAVAEYMSSLEFDQVGVPSNIWERFRISELEMLVLEILGPRESVKYIREKFLGKKITKKRALKIMDDIVKNKLTPVEMTYFASLGFCPGFSQEELYNLTWAMVETGEKLDFTDLGDLVVDKHSIGGLAHKTITPVLVPILVEMGFLVPNTFSRAITTPAGTGDVVEVLMPVSLTASQIKDTVAAVGGVLAWGGAINLAPADDILIQVSKPLHIESHDKFVVSIMAKKVAMGIKYLLIDLPYGKYAKIRKEDLSRVEGMFKFIAQKFGIKLATYPRVSFGLDGRSVGPALEARDTLRILERHPLRPLHVENIVIDMAATLGVLTGKYESKTEALHDARRILETKLALERFWKMAYAQGAGSRITSDYIETASYKTDIKWGGDTGIVKYFNNRVIVKIARALGAPNDKKAGMYFNYFVGDKISKNDVLVTLFAESKARLEMGARVAKEVLDNLIELEDE